MENKFSVEDAVKKAYENVPVPDKEEFWNKLSAELDKEMPERKPFFNKGKMVYISLIFISLFALWEAVELVTLKKQFAENATSGNNHKQDLTKSITEPSIESQAIKTISKPYEPDLKFQKENSNRNENILQENNARKKINHTKRLSADASLIGCS